MSLSQQLAEYISACFTGFWLQSHEHQDVLREIAQMCRDQDWRLATWNVDQGLQIPGSDMPAEAGGNDPLAAVRSSNALASPDSSALLVLQNFHRFMQSAEIVQALAHQMTTGKQNRTLIVILAPVVRIPTESEKLMVVVEHELSDRAQLAEVARGIATDSLAGHPQVPDQRPEVRRRGRLRCRGRISERWEESAKTPTARRRAVDLRWLP